MCNASGWGGSSGHDSVIIAYDSLLASKGSWETFCRHAIFHGGNKTWLLLLTDV
jgi:hypothetical protein